MLKSKYNININQRPLKLFLISIKNQMKDNLEEKQFEEYLGKIPYRPILILADYLETYINFFGRDYKNHIPRLHQYLLNKYYNISRSELEELIKKIKRDMATSKWKNKSHFDFLTWDEFEQLIANLFKNTGYDVFLTKKSNDQGADIIGETIYEKIVVQAKFRKNKKNVGVSAVQEIHAARGVYGATRAIAICTSGFTKSAKKMAQKLGVELWDRAILLAELKRINFW